MITQKAILSLITILVYGSLYIVSRNDLSDLYLFGWTARHTDKWICMISLILLRCDQFSFFFFILIGNLAGILLGQFVKDMIKEANMLKITSDMDAQTVSQFRHHPGFEIRLLTMFLFVCGYILFHFIRKKKHSKNV